MQHAVALGNLNRSRLFLTARKPNSLKAARLIRLQSLATPLLQEDHLNGKMGYLLSSLDLSFSRYNYISTP